MSPTNPPAPDILLQEKIQARTAKIAVIGIGYVGLPLAAAFADARFPTTGFDLDTRKVDSIRRGESYIPDVESALVQKLVNANTLTASTDDNVLRDADVIFICVPTPFDRMKAPDLGMIRSASESIAKHMQRGQMVILQSTTYPGTTEEFVLPILETSGLKAGEDFYLAFSPERIDPGNKEWSARNMPKVLGGLTPRSTELARQLLATLTPQVHLVSTPRAAEMTKLLENIFRSVNIALVNELALLCERMDIDIWEVIDAAKTKPFGFMPFYPSAGVGGHCLAPNEFIFVRDANGLNAVRLGDYFASQKNASAHVRTVGDVTLIEDLNAQILSFDLNTGSACFKPLEALSGRPYTGNLVDILTTDRRTLSVTDGHPMTVYSDGMIQIKPAATLCTEDELILPTSLPFNAPVPEIDLIAHLDAAGIARTRITPIAASLRDFSAELTAPLKALGVLPREIYRTNQLPLSIYLELEAHENMPLARAEMMLRTGRGPAAANHPAVITLDADFARLIGYYLAEGCITSDKSLRTRWTFNSNEREYIDDVCGILSGLGLRYSTHKDHQFDALQIKLSSNLFAKLLRDALKCGVRSTEMQIPAQLLGANEEIRKALLAGLLRGDGDVDLTQETRHYFHQGKQKEYDHAINVATLGYFSSSPILFQQTLLLAQSLGLVPTIKKDKPYFRLYGQAQLERATELFDGAKRAKLEKYAEGRRKQMPTKSFTAHENFATVRVSSITKRYGTHTVYSAEVADTHTFVTSYGILTHNCIPVDPYYLSWKAREYDFYTKFIELAAEVNQTMPFHVVNMIADAVNRDGKALDKAKVLVLGVAFKRDIDDARNSPAERIIELLLSRRANVSYHDPYVPQFHIGDNVFHRSTRVLENSALTAESLQAADVVVIVTGHRSVDYAMVLKHAKRVVDTTSVTAKLDKNGAVIRLGAPSGLHAADMGVSSAA